MTEKEKNNIEKISKGVISYLEFLKLFKKVKDDDIISQELQNKNKFSYIFRQFELECYLIDKKYLDEFRKDINFNELINLLNPINEENKKKFEIELKKYLDKNPFIPNGENIKLYSEINEMKELVKDFNNYSFINKELLKAMGVPESKFEGKMMKVSKNGKNTSLLFNSNNYILSIEVEKKKEKIRINKNDDYILNKIKNDKEYNLKLNNIFDNLQIYNYEGYDLKLNNISYNLQIYNDDNFIYFNLIEKNEIVFYSNKYDLKSIIKLLNLSPNIYNDLNKIKILFNEAYKNNKLTLTLNNNNSINIIIRIIFNFVEINCKIELYKENLEINEKINFILYNLEKLIKNKNVLLMKKNLLDIKNNIGIKINGQNKENYIDNYIINSYKNKNYENKETQTIFEQNNENNNIMKNNDITKLNALKEDKNNAYGKIMKNFKNRRK